jgi:hypothetical protein
MKATTAEGRTIELKQDTPDKLKKQLRGPSLVPDDAGYDDSRTVWNAMIDREPPPVVRCPKKGWRIMLTGKFCILIYF